MLLLRKLWLQDSGTDLQGQSSRTKKGGCETRSAGIGGGSRNNRGEEYNSGSETRRQFQESGRGPEINGPW